MSCELSISSHDDHSLFTRDDSMVSIPGSSSANDKHEVEARQVKQMAKAETNFMRISKTLVLLSIFAAAIGVSTGTYWILQDEEKKDFEKSFDLFAKTAADTTSFHAANVFLSMKTASEAITSAGSTGENKIRGFPFVTVENFEVLGAATREQSGLETLFWHPLVEGHQQNEWILYTVANQGWLEQSRAVAKLKRAGLVPLNYIEDDIPPVLWERDENLKVQATTREPPYLPVWQMSPPPFNPRIINFNAATFPGNQEHMEAARLSRGVAMHRVSDLSRLGLVALNPADHDAFHDALVDWTKPADQEFSGFNNPHCAVAIPVYNDLFNIDDSNIAGYLVGGLAWDRYVVDLVPEGVSAITLVIENSCNQSFSYELNGNRATFLGNGDMHEQAYTNMRVDVPFEPLGNSSETTNAHPGHCHYKFAFYPTESFENEYRTNLPAFMTFIVAGTFGVLVVCFLFYDLFVERRTSKILSVAAKSGAIVASMFPSTVRDRLFANDDEQQVDHRAHAMPTRLKNFMQDGELDIGDDEDEDILKTKPIADLFPNVTVIFADLVGFTAWSSVREPSQVFTLLETLYRAFDLIARQRGVFKVETIGDCYVAVSGLPEPRKNHALVMTRFASDIRSRFNVLVKKLERTLGPDTGELNIRIGLHSGPVTAGVLRGENARFQLFGDTMNTCSRMESNGERDRIHASQETADLLIAGGKSHWVSPREDKIKAKGKGELQTYWLQVVKRRGMRDIVRSSTDASTSQLSSIPNVDPELLTMDKQKMDKLNRLIDWNTDVLFNLLKQMVLQRTKYKVEGRSITLDVDVELSPGQTVIDEVQEIIQLPQHRGKEATSTAKDLDSVHLDENVEKQLREYVSVVASLYNDNPFHSFEHASHVTMSVVKLMSRIVAPSDIKSNESLHDHTYGITSDPLTQFACVLSALIHDVDHSGVPNTRLVKEKPEMAAYYKNQSIAEQNSIDMAWNLLMDKSYKQLRSVIYTTDAERRRFRQIVVNSVMATDIVDKELKTLRNKRWDKAFNESPEDAEESDESVNRKATIVIEHLIQASDIAHTMQHWHIYRKWNTRLFEEMYKAYREGRSANDPSESWYRGEIGFFDFYIIPLAKKLKNCGVFGVSSDEYLNYAMNNRREWEERGQEVVAEMVEQVRREYEENNDETEVEES